LQAGSGCFVLVKEGPDFVALPVKDWYNFKPASRCAFSSALHWFLPPPPPPFSPLFLFHNVLNPKQVCLFLFPSILNLKQVCFSLSTGHQPVLIPFCGCSGCVCVGGGGQAKALPSPYLIHPYVNLWIHQYGLPSLLTPLVLAQRCSRWSHSHPSLANLTFLNHVEATQCRWKRRKRR